MIKDFVFRQKFDKYEILSDKYEIGNMKFVLPSGFGKLHSQKDYLLHPSS